MRSLPCHPQQRRKREAAQSLRPGLANIKTLVNCRATSTQRADKGEENPGGCEKMMFLL